MRIQNNKKTKLQNVAITGASRGLGLELCRQVLDDEQHQYGDVFALCRSSSDALRHLAQHYSTRLHIVTGLDWTKANCFETVQEVLATKSGSPIPIHVLIHNAAAYGPPEDWNENDFGPWFQTQSLEHITPERMMYAFQLNAMTPLFLTKALVPNLKQAVTENHAHGVKDRNIIEKKRLVKVLIVSSTMGSLHDNTTGRAYGYRVSKASANMVGRTLSCDLPKLLVNIDENGNQPAAPVVVGMVHPGFLRTDFAPPLPPSLCKGQRSVADGARGVLKVLHETMKTPENSGNFWDGNYGDEGKEVQECDW